MKAPRLVALGTRRIDEAIQGGAKIERTFHVVHARVILDRLDDVRQRVQRSDISASGHAIECGGKEVRCVRPSHSSRSLTCAIRSYIDAGSCTLAGDHSRSAMVVLRGQILESMFSGVII